MLGTWPHRWSFRASQVVLVVKNLPASGGDAAVLRSIPELGRSSGGDHGNQLQCSCLENPMDRGAWQATVRGIAKSQTRLKWQRAQWSSLCSSLKGAPEKWFGCQGLWARPLLPASSRHGCRGWALWLRWGTSKDSICGSSPWGESVLFRAVLWSSTWAEHAGSGECSRGGAGISELIVWSRVWPLLSEQCSPLSLVSLSQGSVSSRE